MRWILLLTGGTIGSVMQDNVLDVGGNPADKLLECLKDRKRFDPEEITCKNVMHILSENMQFSHWMKLYEAIRAISEDDVDGILITHGTDTLSYTAAFLAMVCTKVKIPIFLISSHLSLEEPQADGYDNFIAALDFAKEVRVCGVFVPTTECNGDASRVTTIHLGSRLTQSQGFTHRFQSVGDISFGKMIDGRFERNPSACNPEIWQLQQGEAVSPTASALIANTLRKQLLTINENQQPRHVLLWKAFPGMDFDLFDWKIKPEAILIELYHSGTACTRPQDAPYSIIAFGRRCKEQGIGLYVVNFDTRKKLYQSSQDIQEAGIRILPDISTEAAYVKLCIAYRAFEEQENRDQFMDENVAFEKLNRLEI
jgi:L-asparaginase